MAGLVKPRNFPIRKPTDNTQDLGKIYNPRRFPDHGGFTSAGALTDGGPFNVQAPEKGSTSATQARKSTED